MANANVSRLGQINQTGDEKALFLKKFAGEVLTSFHSKTVMLDKHLVRTIESGKSAQFPVVGLISAEYHTPGNEISGMKVNHAEKVITIDDLLISHAFVANIDEAMNHYDVRSIYTAEMGQKLANEFDKNVIKEGIKGARSSAIVADGYGGTQLTNDDFINATLSTRANAILEAIFTAAQTFDEKNVPDEERYAILHPADYYAILQNKDAINKDWGGAGSYAEGDVRKVAGITLLKSNNLPTTDDSFINMFHGVDATKTRGLIFQSKGIGTVKLLDLAVESEYQINRQGTLLVSKYAVGHGFLRPECCIELNLNILTN